MALPWFYGADSQDRALAFGRRGRPLACGSPPDAKRHRFDSIRERWLKRQETTSCIAADCKEALGPTESPPVDPDVAPFQKRYRICPMQRHEHRFIRDDAEDRRCQCHWLHERVYRIDSARESEQGNCIDNRSSGSEPAMRPPRPQRASDKLSCRWLLGCSRCDIPTFDATACHGADGLDAIMRPAIAMTKRLREVKNPHQDTPDHRARAFAAHAD